MLLGMAIRMPMPQHLSAQKGHECLQLQISKLQPLELSALGFTDGVTQTICAKASRRCSIRHAVNTTGALLLQCSNE